jgi:hypothetical protein
VEDLDCSPAPAGERGLAYLPVVDNQSFDLRERSIIIIYMYTGTQRVMKYDEHFEFYPDLNTVAYSQDHITAYGAEEDHPF